MEGIGLGYLGAGIGAGLAVIGAGLGIGNIAASAAEGTAVSLRQLPRSVPP